MPPPDLNISPEKDPSITSGLTHEAAEDEDASLLGGTSLALDPAGENISLLSEEASLTGGDVYTHGDASLRSLTKTGHTSASNMKQATSLIPQ